MKKEKIIRCILLILLIAIITVITILTINTIVKFNIIQKYISKSENIGTQNNIYLEITHNEGSNSWNEEYWTKDGKYLYKLGNTIIYKENIESSIGWIILTDEKIAQKLDLASTGLPIINTAFFETSFSGKLKEVCNSKITKNSYDGKNCYKIEKIENLNVSDTIYVDKETFNPLRVINSMQDCSYKFEIGIVTNEQVSFPDITGYEIIDKTI